MTNTKEQITVGDFVQFNGRGAKKHFAKGVAIVLQAAHQERFTKKDVITVAWIKDKANGYKNKYENGQCDGSYYASDFKLVDPETFDHYYHDAKYQKINLVSLLHYVLKGYKS